MKLLLLNKSGILERRSPLRPWDAVPLASILRANTPGHPDAYFDWRQQRSPKFFFSRALSDQARKKIGGGSIRLANEILVGQFPYFGSSRFLGFPPNWQRNPFTGETAPGGHWSTIDDFAFGDIKLWWETSRFTWVFALVRAHFRSGDMHYAEAFWILLESWMDQNPPNWGVNWKCGQEAAFRAMALCFAFYAFGNSSSATPQRLSRLVILLHALAIRIDANIEYALSQKNNHGISEAAGLWTIGLLFPELRSADRWQKRGKTLLEREIQRQIYEDGSYVQHSTNYHRVLLQVAGWALRIGEANGVPLSPRIYDLLRKAIFFLHSLTDPESGWPPNYGANDGAHVLPLTDCAFPDMRPVLQSCHFLIEKSRLYAVGPWDEESMWLNGENSVAEATPLRTRTSTNLTAASGGYYTLNSGESWAMIRGAKYRDRPSHADQLHVDLWWRGENVLCDAGTYSYNLPRPFDHALAATRFHNTVTIDGKDQMTRLSPFLWADWASATVARRHTNTPGINTLHAEHNGYRELGVLHHRALVQFDKNIWIIIDDIIGAGIHTARLHWLTPEVPFEVHPLGRIEFKFRNGPVRLLTSSSSASTFCLVRAGALVAGEQNGPIDAALGWHSRYYGHKEAALSSTFECVSLLPLRFVTILLLGITTSVYIDPSCATIGIGDSSLRILPMSGFSGDTEFLSRC